MTMEVGEYLAYKRHDIGLTQDDVARFMRQRGSRWSQSTVWAVEKGSRPLRFDEAVVLSHFLGIDIAELAKFIGGVDPCQTCRDRPPIGMACLTCGRTGGAS